MFVHLYMICTVSQIAVCFKAYYFILQENPSEEDAAIVDKVLSMRLTKKEVCSIQLTFFIPPIPVQVFYEFDLILIILMRTNRLLSYR